MEDKDLEKGFLDATEKYEPFLEVSGRHLLSAICWVLEKNGIPSTSEEFLSRDWYIINVPRRYLKEAERAFNQAKVEGFISE